MRRVLLFALGGLLSACSGGGGDLPTFGGRSERAGTTNEPARTTNERAGAMNEPAPISESRPGTDAGTAPPSAPGASLACAGRYRCETNDDDEPDDVTLTKDGAACLVDSVRLEANGTVTQNGAAVGSWTATSRGFIATSGAIVTTCTKR